MMLRSIAPTYSGAGEGNRTLVCSLGSCRSAIELRPRNLGRQNILLDFRPLSTHHVVGPIQANARTGGYFAAMRWREIGQHERTSLRRYPNGPDHYLTNRG